MREHILKEIRRIADANGGKAPGLRGFERETGIDRKEWFPELWVRWGDAVAEAGFTANTLQQPYSKEYLVERFVGFIRELGHVPVKGELLRKSKQDKSFPNEKVFYREGKENLLRRVLAHCKGRAELQDVAALCAAEFSDADVPGTGKSPAVATGYVYLMRSGRHFKIGRTVSVGSRERQLAIKIPVPPTTLHSIQTDDPVGVERYWHERFATKRGEGEWFALSPEDVAAFKRWKKLV